MASLWMDRDGASKALKGNCLCCGVYPMVVSRWWPWCATSAHIVFGKVWGMSIFVTMTAVMAVLATVVGTAAATVRPGFMAAVNEGRVLFTTNAFFSAKMIQGRPVTCATCHLNGGISKGQMPGGHTIPSLVNALAIFPRYSPKEQKVITLQTQIRICVNAGLGGTPPAYGGQTMTAMITYLGSLADGQTVNIGGKKH